MSVGEQSYKAKCQLANSHIRQTDIAGEAALVEMAVCELIIRQTLIMQNAIRQNGSCEMA